MGFSSYGQNEANWFEIPVLIIGPVGLYLQCSRRTLKPG